MHPCPSVATPDGSVAEVWLTDLPSCPVCGFDPVAIAEAEYARLRELEDNVETMSQTRKIIHHIKKLEVCRETIGLLNNTSLYWCLEHPALLTLRAKVNPTDMYLELPLASRWMAIAAGFPKGIKP